MPVNFEQNIETYLKELEAFINMTVKMFENKEIDIKLLDDSVEFLKNSLKEKKITVVNFLKAFPRKKRLDVVDMLRGALPIPIDFKELNMIAQVLDLDKEDIYST